MKLLSYFFALFLKIKGAVQVLRQLWEDHTLIIVIENAELIGMGVFRTWYWKEDF